MFWVNDEHEVNRHTAPLYKWAYLVTSGLFLMFLLVFPYHSYGFEAASAGFSGGSSAGGSIGGGSIGGGSFSSFTNIGFGSSGSSSGEIEEVIFTAPRISPSSGVTWVSGAALDGWVFSSLDSNIGPP